MTTLGELMPAAQALSRAEKAELVRVLQGDLAKPDVYALIEPGVAYEVRLPDESFEAAAMLLDMLEQKRTRP